MRSAKAENPQTWLGDVQSEYWEQVSGPGSPDEEPGLPHVLFEVAGSRFAVDARCCKGVFRKPETTELPGLPAHVLGVVGIRGEMISATDPAHYLRLSGTRPESPGYLLILAEGDLRTALWVDRVFEVTPLGSTEPVPCHAQGTEESKGVVVGRVAQDGGEVLVLDGRKFLECTAVVGDPGFGNR